MKKITIFFIFIVIVIITIALWWRNGLLPVNSHDKKPRIFVIQNGAGLKEVTNKLKEQGLIKDSIVFFLYSRLGKFEGKIQAGDFRLAPSMTAQRIAENLTHGTLDIWITIQEGKRADEIADILSKKMPNYKLSWRNTLSKNEGYLFPDTYLIPKDAGIDLIISALRSNFEKKFLSLSLSPTNKLTKNEIATIASLIEREAKFPQDRMLVASVIINRLNIGMKLDIDATLQYALGYQPDQKTWWKKELTNQDKEINSFYNTYRIAGLPPTPISNPSLASLNAVVNPAKTNYLFYMTDGKGVTHYAETLNQHNTNIQKFGL